MVPASVAGHQPVIPSCQAVRTNQAYSAGPDSPQQVIFIDDDRRLALPWKRPYSAWRMSDRREGRNARKAVSGRTPRRDADGEESRTRFPVDATSEGRSGRARYNEGGSSRRG